MLVIVALYFLIVYLYQEMSFCCLQNLQRELSEAQQLALCLDDKIQENVHSAETLQAFAQR